MSTIHIETKGKRKPRIHVSLDDLKILQAEDKFKAKRDKQLLDKLEKQKELLEYWFANTYPDIRLKVHLILSRKMEELEVRKELKYYKNNSDGTPDEKNFQVIALTDTVYSHTWYNPYLMEKYVDSFVETHKDAIEKVIKFRENYK